MPTLTTTFVGFPDERTDQELEQLARFALEVARTASREFFYDLPTDVEVRVEAGSVLLRTRIYAAAASVVVFLGTYGVPPNWSRHLERVV
jgi:hypothetical protein